MIAEWNWPSVLFYGLVIISASFFAAIPKGINEFKNSKFIRLSFLVLSFLVAWIPAAIRYGIGTDYYRYCDGYFIRIFGNNILALLVLPKEPGFIIINYLARIVFNNVQFVFVISSFLSLFFVYAALYRNYDKINIGMAIFLFMSIFYLGSYNIVRQFIAISIVFYSYRYLISRNFIKFALCILLAACFHTSAFFVLPIYGVTGYGKTRVICMFLFLFSLALIFMNYQRFIVFIGEYDLFEKYTTYTPILKYGLGRIIERLPILVPVMFFRKKLIAINKEYIIWIDFLWIELFVSLFSYINIYINRISLYFAVSQILFFANVTHSIKKPYKNIVKAGILCYGTWYWLFYYMYSGIHQVVPYDTFFGKYF